MPIKITDCNWSQKGSSLFINLGLKNFSTKDVDIICTSSYVKVNFKPYIFEAFLCHKVLPERSSSTIREGTLYLHLIKALNEKWKSLDSNPKNKECAQALRTEALKEYEELQKKISKEKRELKVNLEQLAIAKQISLNEEKQNRQKEALKQEERKFFSEIEETKDETTKSDRFRLSSLCSEDGSLAISEGDYDGDEESLNFSSTENLAGMLKNGQEPKTKAVKEDPRPEPRQSCIIKFHHTPYKPSVPKRDSLANAREEELSNAIELETENESHSKERDSLRCEATKCFNCGDFDGAVKCYSSIIDLFPSLPSSFSNRAAAYFALNSYSNAIKDCSKALELLSPPTPENAKSRLLCHVRRGTSHVRLKDFTSGLRDFEAAFRLDPNNVALAKDAAVIRAALTAYTTDSGDDSDESDSISYEDSEDQSEAEVSDNAEKREF